MYYIMSIPEIMTLLFIFSLWIISIVCCIKRYEKISTIERADMPQYRKDMLGSPTSPEDSSSSSCKSPISIPNSPTGMNLINKNQQHLITSSPSRMQLEVDQPVTVSTTAATIRSSTRLVDSYSRSSSEYVNEPPAIMKKNFSLYSTKENLNESNKQFYYEIMAPSETQPSLCSQLQGQYQKYRIYNNTNQSRHLKNVHHTILHLNQHNSQYKIQRRTLSNQSPMHNNDTNQSSENSKHGSAAYSHFKKLNPLAIYNHPAFVFHQQGAQTSRNSNAGSLYMLDETIDNASKNRNSTHSHLKISLSGCGSGSKTQNYRTSIDSDINESSALPKSNSEPAFQEMTLNGKFSGEENLLSSTKYKASKYNTAFSYERESSLPPLVLTRAKSSDYKKSKKYDNDLKILLNEQSVAAKSSNLPPISVYSTNEYINANTFDGEMSNLRGHQMLNKFDTSSKTEPDDEKRLDPKRIPKVIKKSLIDLHKRSMWNLAHSAQHQEHLQHVHRQKLQQQQHRRLFNWTLGNSNQTAPEKPSSNTTDFRKKSVINLTSHNKNSNPMTNCIETSLKRENIIGAGSGLMSQPTSVMLSSFSQASYHVSANVIRQSNPKHEIKMKITDNFS